MVLDIIFLQPSYPDNDGGAAPCEPGPSGSGKKRQRKEKKRSKSQ